MQQTHVMSLMPATVAQAKGFKRREAATVGCTPDIQCKGGVLCELLKQLHGLADKRAQACAKLNELEVGAS
jgi:hypothetical protein